MFCKFYGTQCANPGILPQGLAWIESTLVGNSLQRSEGVLRGTDHVLMFEKGKLWTRSLVKLQSMLPNSLSLLYGFFNFTYVKPCKLCFHFEIQIYQFYKSTVLFASKPKHYEEVFFYRSAVCFTWSSSWGQPCTGSFHFANHLFHLATQQKRLKMDMPSSWGIEDTQPIEDWSSY